MAEEIPPAAPEAGAAATSADGAAPAGDSTTGRDSTHASDPTRAAAAAAARDKVPAAAVPQRGQPVQDAGGGLSRFINRQGRSNVVALGLHRSRFGDLYHAWLIASWRMVLAASALSFLGLNLLFGGLYLWVGGIENARPASFADAFFFSVQTFATIGYGRLAPVSTAANVVVTVESFVGLLATAMVTGLMFAKFARPTSRVLWSRVAVVAPQDGVRSLMIRMANERGNRVVEAQLRLSLARQEITVEGEQVRRVHDLRLVRSRSSVFVLTWTAIHPIDESSPLYGLTKEDLVAQGVEIIASLTGLDETFSQTIHSRHAWAATEIVFDARFADILVPLPDGRRAIDYTRFHETKPL
jgi:inward rectifier potassium channel